jgi:hypothetical protein
MNARPVVAWKSALRGIGWAAVVLGGWFALQRVILPALGCET